MKKLIFLLVVIVLYSCSSDKGDTFMVNGTLKNFNVQTVYLEQAEPDGSRPVVIDSAQVDKSGKFSLNTVATEQKLYYLRADGEPYPFAGVINDTKKVSIDVDPSRGELATFIVKGSEASQEKIKFDHLLSQKTQAIMTAAKLYDSVGTEHSRDSAVLRSIDSAKTVHFAAYEGAVNSLRDEVLQLVNNTKSPVLVLYALQTFQGLSKYYGFTGFNRTELGELIAKASDRFPSHKGLAEQKKKSGSATAPDFSLPDTSGRAVSLSSFRGKYVLVDFWASWCRPCREENPNVVAAYQQFRDKNFTILGVSLDRAREPWLEAIHQDQLNWNHVSDLKYWNSEAAALYGVTSIPYNFLLDPQGNIIAENIRGNALAATLGKFIR